MTAGGPCRRVKGAPAACLGRVRRRQSEENGSGLNKRQRVRSRSEERYRCGGDELLRRYARAVRAAVVARRQRAMSRSMSRSPAHPPGGCLTMPRPRVPFTSFLTTWILFPKLSKATWCVPYARDGHGILILLRAWVTGPPRSPLDLLSHAQVGKNEWGGAAERGARGHHTACSRSLSLGPHADLTAVCGQGTREAGLRVFECGKADARPLLAVPDGRSVGVRLVRSETTGPFYAVLYARC